MLFANARAVASKGLKALIEMPAGLDSPPCVETRGSPETRPSLTEGVSTVGFQKSISAQIRQLVFNIRNDDG